ncbi:MAG: hypothetical protein LUB59_03820 [Candidatus Gastranaerophilales bacterium]|nr:hypothetical protein [Candidatus Gastranaerophilales bacterium]
MALLHGFIFAQWHPGDLQKIIVYYFFAVILGVMSAIIWKSDKFSRALLKFSRKTTDSDIFNGLLDFDGGTGVNVVLKNGDIINGSVFRVEENGNDSWIALHDYDIYQHDGLEVHSSDFKEEGIVLIKRNDILRIHYTYTPNTKMSDALVQQRGRRIEKNKK